MRRGRHVPLAALANRGFETMMTAMTKFLRDRRGNASIFYAFAVFPLVVLAGGVVDYSSALKVKAGLQSGLDSAALAAAAMLKSSNVDLTEAQLTAKARQYLEANLAQYDVENTSVQVTKNGTTLDVTAQTEMPTTFLRLIGIGEMHFKARSQTTYNFPPLEVALVLDNTGSMDFYGNGTDRCNGRSFCRNKTRMFKLKAAARKFVTDLKAKVVDDPQSLKIGIVPYSTYVRLKNSYQNANWLDTSKAQTCTSWSWTWSWRQGWHQVCDQYGVDWNGYVGFRTNRNNEEDGSYSLEKIPAINRDSAPYSQRLAQWGNYNLVPQNLARVMPLKALTEQGKTKLINRINAMQPDGGTYIPGGLIWGARMLSHQEPLDEGMSYDDQGDKKARKVIVLMTDGVNTCSQMSGNENYIDCYAGNTVDQAGLDSMARICSSLKETNPDTGLPYADIITIGFDLSDLPAGARSKVEDSLRSCASLGYYPASRDDIANVFGRIGSKLSMLRLSR